MSRTGQHVLIPIIVCGWICTSAAQPAADDDPLGRAVKAFQAGNYGAAVHDLEVAHAADPADVDTTLLLGITYYKLRRLDDAVPLLETASAAANDETAGSARVFLALIALERDEVDRARAFLHRIADAPGSDLAATARALLERASTSRLLVVAVARTEYDTNVPLLPTTATPMTSGGDANLMLASSISYRPLRSVPLAFDASASYRRQLHLTDFDLASAALLAELDGGAVDAALGGEGMLLGGEPFVLGGHGRVAYRVHISDGIVPWIGYRPIYRDYEPVAYAGYTGLIHDGTLGIALGRPSATVRLEASYDLLRESMRDPALVAFANAAMARLRVRLWRVDATAGGSLIWRSFDAGRSDRQSNVDASVAFDLTSGLGIVAGVTYLNNASSDANLTMTS